jgi:hypothetical protein
MKHNPGIGSTPDLSLRVSIATLARVVFKHPGHGELMLALERKATLHGSNVEVKSQPFGGAIRILNLDAIYDLIGDFHFDSERSRSEQDFRLFIRPSAWSVLREFCIERLSLAADPILETNPTRELVEEFADALKIDLKPEQFIQRPVATIVENKVALTDNIHVKGAPTVRVYRVFEVDISDPALIHALTTNSDNISHQDLSNLALEDARNGGKGRANAILALPLKRITDTYLVLTPDARNVTFLFENNRLDGTVPVVLDGITVPKYQRL